MAGYIGSKVAVVSSGAERKKVFTATSGQTSFTGLSYTVNNVHVFQNGVRLVDGTDYTATNGNSITLTVGAATDDQVVVVSYNTFQTSDTVSASAGGTFSNAVTIDADGSTVLTVDRATSDGTIIDLQKSGSSVGSVGVYSSDNLYLQGKSDHSGLAFGEAEIYGFRGGSENDGVTSLGSAGGRFKDLYLSGGVYLGGTGSANKLDDYEEGTFSPMTSTEADVYHARYTKIGNLVTINCCFNMKSGQSRNNISLPFTPLNDGVGKNTASNDATNNRYSGSVSFFEASTSVTNLMLFHQGNQGASAYFIAQSGSMQWPEDITDTEYNAVAVSFTYQTS